MCDEETKRVAAYFEKSSWSCTQLESVADRPKDDKVPDLEICKEDYCCLCEVKTLGTTLAGEFALRELLGEVDKLARRSRAADLDLAYGVHIFTVEDVKLPYKIKDIEVMAGQYWEWLERKLFALERQGIGYGLHDPYKYPVPVLTGNGKTRYAYILNRIIKRKPGTGLHIYFSGVSFRFKGIERQIQKGVKQLNAQADRDRTLIIPRIIVFTTDPSVRYSPIEVLNIFGPTRQERFQESMRRYPGMNADVVRKQLGLSKIEGIQQEMKKYPTLSAIGFLVSLSRTIPRDMLASPPKELHGLLSRLVSAIGEERADVLVILHNPYLQKANPFDEKLFTPQAQITVLHDGVSLISDC